MVISVMRSTVTLAWYRLFGNYMVFMENHTVFLSLQNRKFHTDIIVFSVEIWLQNWPYTFPLWPYNSGSTHENAMKAQNLIGLAGLFFYTFICILLSKAPYKINWRPVLWGYFTQLVLGILVLRTTAGYIAFKEDFSIQNCSMITTRGHQGSKWTVQA